jgi:hypothetical protein
MINLINRQKQVDKIRDEFQNNPYFDDITSLYLTGQLYRITSVTKLLRKIKYKKDGSVDKRTNKQIEKFIKINTVDDSVLGCNEVKLTIDNIDEYDFPLHKIEFLKIRKEFKNALYTQEIKYYKKDGSFINDELIEPDGDIIPFFNQKESTKVISNKFFDKLTYKMVISTDGKYEWKPKLLINDIDETHYVIITTCAFKKNEPKQTNKKQTFKADDDGICVYNNFVEYFSSKIGDKKAKTQYNKLMSDEGQKYKKAYKHEELNEICSFCNASLYIRDLVRGSDYDIVIKNDYARFKIEMINTKFNHLDLLVSDKEVEIVDDDEYFKMKKELKFYVEKYGKLYTRNSVYKKRDTPFKLLKQQWFEDYGIRSKFIFEDSDEQKIIDEYDYNKHSFFNDMPMDNDKLSELDLKKAYYNYSDKTINKHYVGVPTGSFINTKCGDGFTTELYNEITKKGFIGFYQVKILKVKSKKDHFKKLNFIENQIHTLTTPMINLLLKHIDFKFLNASYSTTFHCPFDSKIEIEEIEKCEKKFCTEFFNDDGEYIDEKITHFTFLDKAIGKDSSPKAYCKLFGQLESCDPSTILVKPLQIDEDYYTIINDKNYDIHTEYDIINITLKDEKIKSYKHLTHFIHSYTKTLIIEQILNMDIDIVYGVKLDSIVFNKNYDVKYDENVYNLKKAKVTSMFKGYMNISSLDSGIDDDDQDITESGYYCNYTENNDKKLKFPLPFLNNDGKYHFVTNRIVMIGGKGGSGKTYSILKNDGLNKNMVCYTTSCWNLIQGIKDKYKDTIGYSLPNLTGKCGSIKTEKIENPNIRFIVVDELTLVSKSAIDDIIKLYPNAFIFLVGDIAKNGFYYQCTLPLLKIIDPSKEKNIQYIEYTKSYRFDDKLSKLLDSLRQFMVKVKDQKWKAYSVFNWVKKVFSTSFYDKKDIIYNDNDVGITACDDFKRGNHTTKYFVDKGTKPRYFVAKTNRQKNELRGAEIIGKPTNNNYECKLFKTIHSFQGLDLDDDNKIIINVDKNFDFNLFYTALSRARRLDQIKIISQ